MQVGESTERLDETDRNTNRSQMVLRGILPGDTTRVALGGPRIVLGRGPEAAVQLEWRGISRSHAEIYRQGPVHALRDLDSTNGTFANGERVQHCALAAGTLLRIGDWLGLIEDAPSTEAPRHFGDLGSGIFGGETLYGALEPLLRSAPTELPVALVGETGTGKERFARALHAASGRDGPFHAINCAALAAQLADAELFGCVKGAFTGADRAREGHLRAAHGGTLFLDEFAELPLTLQAKLLRALELFEVVPVGDTRSFAFDARVVVGCQRPLEELVRERLLRADLAARVAGLVVRIPPLRERRGDIPALFHTFLLQYSGGRPPAVSTRLYEQLCLRPWAGNVRELLQLARQLLAVHGFEPVLRRSHLPVAHAALAGAADADGSGEPALPQRFSTRREHDASRLADALQKSSGNVTRAAESLGISRQRAYRLLEGRGNLSRTPSANGGTGEQSE